jgi:hypothetical protein
MYSGADFPIGSKKRIAGLKLTATDVDWPVATHYQCRARP